MAEVLFAKPLRSWWAPWGGIVIRLTHDDVEFVDDAATPLSAITALIKPYGHIAAVAIKTIWWLVRKLDKKFGERGVVIVVGVQGFGAWAYGPDSDLVERLTR